MSVSSKSLKTMSEISIDTVDINDLVDVERVVTDCKQPISQRIESYIEQIKNPYCFRCGDTPIRIKFMTDDALSDKLVDFFTSLKNR